MKTVMMTPDDVMALLKVKRDKAIELMGRLPHVDLAPADAKRRSLRITETTLEAFCNGKISLGETNIVVFPKTRTTTPRAIEYRK